jgi:acyl carrier protein
MNTIAERLLKCFRNAFPEIRINEIPRASTASLAAWDSVTHVVLLTAISEEFGCNVAPEDFEHLVSYGLIAQYVADWNGRFERNGEIAPEDLDRDRSAEMIAPTG